MTRPATLARRPVPTAPLADAVAAAAAADAPRRPIVRPGPRPVTIATMTGVSGLAT
jgi:hypothetical protein